MPDRGFEPTGLARLLCTRGTEGYNDFLRFPGTAASPEGIYRVRRYHSPLPRILGVVILELNSACAERAEATARLL